MPYIPQKRRDTEHTPETPGDLHYDVSQLVDKYLYHGSEVPPNYQRFNDVMGVLACAQAEIYRRLVAPYEDEKLLENGEVYSVSQADELGQCLDPTTCRCGQ